jgi:transposase InsO family protein
MIAGGPGNGANVDHVFEAGTNLYNEFNEPGALNEYPPAIYAAFPSALIPPP